MRVYWKLWQTEANFTKKSPFSGENHSYSRKKCYIPR